jgi:hypothetical protein
VFPEEGSREARAFALWLNSLGIDPYVNNLFEVSSVSHRGESQTERASERARERGVCVCV